MKNTANRHH